MVKEQQGASFNPDTFQEGGGLLDNVDVKWKEVKATTWDYNGTIPNEVPAVCITMEVEDVEDAVEQYFSCGSAQDWMPSKDGTKLVAVGKATGINKASNFGILLNSLVEAKFPKDKMDTDDLTVFEGLECHMVRQKEPERKGLARTPRADGKTYEKTNLVVDHIIKLPWEKTKGKGTPTKGKKEEEAPEGDDIEAKAIEVVMEVLDENPKGVDKKKLAQLVLKKVMKDPNRKDILALAYDDKFLEEGTWTYEDGKISPLGE